MGIVVSIFPTLFKVFGFPFALSLERITMIQIYLETTKYFKRDM